MDGSALLSPLPANAAIGAMALAPRVSATTPSVDRALLAVLIARELPKLHRLALLLMRNRVEAEDLVQDTILRVLTYAHRWQPETNFGAWARAIMRNQFYTNCIKRNRDANTIINDDTQDRPIPPVQEERLVCCDLAATIGRLPPKQRVVVSLVAFEELGSDEIARRMNISANAVRCHLMRGRKQLRDAAIAARAAS